MEVSIHADMGCNWRNCRVDDGTCRSPADVDASVEDPDGQQPGGKVGHEEPLDKESTVPSDAYPNVESHALTLASGQRKLPFVSFFV